MLGPALDSFQVLSLIIIHIFFLNSLKKPGLARNYTRSLSHIKLEEQPVIEQFPEACSPHTIWFIPCNNLMR